MSDRDAIIRKIQALRARAADAASTEAEAAMAARKAQELLEKHNLTLDEAQVRADGVECQDWDNGKSRAPAAADALPGICKALNVTHFCAGGCISIVGAPADVAVALYYIDLVEQAAWRCWAVYQETGSFRAYRDRGGSARKAGFSFRKGVAIRLGNRIEQQAMEARTASTSTGVDLVVVRDAMQRQWMADHGIRTRNSRPPEPDACMRDGFRAGADVPINRGVGSSHVSKLSLPGVV